MSIRPDRNDQVSAIARTLILGNPDEATSSMAGTRRATSRRLPCASRLLELEAEKLGRAVARRAWLLLTDCSSSLLSAGVPMTTLLTVSVHKSPVGVSSA